MNRNATKDEVQRLAALHGYDVLDTPPEEAFDRITRVVKSALQVPIALISLVDEERQWFKSKQGLDTVQTPREISFCTHAIHQDSPFVVNDANTDDRFADNPLVVGEPNISFYAGVPLKTPDGHNIGTLCAIDSAPRKLGATEIAILQDLARLVIDSLELRRIAMADALTGAHTRRSFDTILDRELYRAGRYNKLLSLVMVDIDNFKSVNDRYGHPVGDAVLRSVAEECRVTLRDADTFARLGGEEFGILLPETDLANAVDLAERLRSKIATTPVKTGGKIVTVTASFGVAQFCGEGDTESSLTIRADAALYLAKNKGRNCVQAADDPELYQQSA